MASLINSNIQILPNLPIGSALVETMIKIDASNFITIGLNGTNTYNTITKQWSCDFRDNWKDFDFESVGRSGYDQISKRVFIPTTTDRMLIFDVETKKLHEIFITTCKMYSKII